MPGVKSKMHSISTGDKCRSALLLTWVFQISSRQ